MLTVIVKKIHTTLSGDTYKKGKTYQLRSKVASELIESGAAVSAGYKGR